MAKKTKKRTDGPRLSERQLYRPGMERVVGTPAAAPVGKPLAVTARPADEDLAEEYRYVLTDLKKIGWLALAMLVSLVALALIVI